MYPDAPSENDRHGRSVAIEWWDCSWQPRIEVRAAAPRRRLAKKSPSAGLLDFSPLRRRNFLYLKIMKTNLPSSRRNHAAFTIVELLTVIGIIAILAAMLLPVLAAAKKHAQKVQARLEESEIVTAIQGYDSAYGRFPVSAVEQASANPDFTFGGSFWEPGSATPVSIGTLVPTATGSVSNNSDVIAILMDLTNYPGAATPTVNANYVKNPQQTIFLNAKMVNTNLTWSGVGQDLVYRDPWGNPYLITMDLNYDEMCRDTFYGSNAVSQISGSTGYNGLVSPEIPPAPPQNDFQYRGKVMVWSAGPDGKIDPSVPANQGANKDNVLSWQ
jgi:type II secretory pathway pseudopilin PulG